MDVPFTLAERARISAENRRVYEAEQLRLAEEKATKSALRGAAIKAARQDRRHDSSCGNVEQTGNPRGGCDCDACVRRRKVKHSQQRAARAAAQV